MSRFQRSARLVQECTGAHYTTCLRKLDDLMASGGGIAAVELYLDRLGLIPDAELGTKDNPLCLDCLKPRPAGVRHTCR